MIRPLEQDDLDDVAALEHQAGDVGWTRDGFARELKHEFNRFFVIRREKDLIGYGGYWKAGAEAQITNLVIHPDHRREGWAMRLLEFLLDCARSEECRHCTLEVRSKNVAARQLYQKAGFHAAGQRAGLYQNPADDALLMERNL